MFITRGEKMYSDDLDKDYNELLKKLLKLRSEVYDDGISLFRKWITQIDRESFLNSCQNLAFYLVLRKKDIRHIQEDLVPWGLSSLGRLESKTLENIDAVISSLGKITGFNLEEITYPSHSSFNTGKHQLEINTEQIFGKSPVNRYTRIMVTLPSEAGHDYKMVYRLISEGMNVARINCAHDDIETWAAMIENIRRAEKELNLSCKVLMDMAGPKVRISWLYTTLKKPKVVEGDILFLGSEKCIHSVGEYDIALGCSIPEILSYLNEDDPVLVDDGIVEGIVESIIPEGVLVRVKKTSNVKGIQLRAEKGLNFPKSNIKIDIITEKDKEDLNFICKNADIIGCSFVKDSADIKFLQDEIQQRMDDERARSISIMAKIETLQGVKNLPEIIVAAASKNPFCVMIARGDLAVEAGYLRLAELQQEILWISEAADIPVIWATQVLDNMVHTGIPTRSEITDAAESGQAECVMLNKGSYIIETIIFLDHIIEIMQEHRYKKTSRLRALGIAKEVAITKDK